MSQGREDRSTSDDGGGTTPSTGKRSRSTGKRQRGQMESEPAPSAKRRVREDLSHGSVPVRGSGTETGSQESEETTERVEEQAPTTPEFARTDSEREPPRKRTTGKRARSPVDEPARKSEPQWIRKKWKPLSGTDWQSVAGKSGRLAKEMAGRKQSGHSGGPQQSSTKPTYTESEGWRSVADRSGRNPWHSVAGKSGRSNEPPPVEHPDKAAYPPEQNPPKDAVPPVASDKNWMTLLEAVDLRIAPLAAHMDRLRTSMYSLKKQWPHQLTLGRVSDAVQDLYLKVVLNLADYVKTRGDWSGRPLENALFYVSFFRSLEDVLATQDSPLITLGRFHQDITRYHTMWWKELAADLLNTRASVFAHFDLVQALNTDMAVAVGFYCDEYYPDAGKENKNDPAKVLQVQMKKLHMSYSVYSKFKQSVEEYRRDWMRKFLFDEWEIQHSLPKLIEQLQEMRETLRKVKTLIDQQFEMFSKTLVKGTPFAIFYELGKEEGELKTVNNFNRPLYLSVRATFTVIATVYDPKTRKPNPGKRHFRFRPVGTDTINYELPKGMHGPEESFSDYLSFTAVLKEIQQWFQYLHASWAQAWDQHLRSEVDPTIEDLIEDYEEFDEWRDELEGQNQEQEEEEDSRYNDGVGECKLPLRIDKETYNGDWSRRPLSIEEIYELLTENHSLEDQEQWEFNQLMSFDPEDLEGEMDTSDHGTIRQPIYDREDLDVTLETNVVKSNPVPTMVYRIKVPMRGSVTELEMREAAKLPFVLNYRRGPNLGWDNHWQQRWFLYATMAKGPKNHFLSYIMKNTNSDNVTRTSTRQFIVTINPNRNDKVLLASLQGWSHESFTDKCNEILRNLDPRFIKDNRYSDVQFSMKNIVRYDVTHQMSEIAPDSGKIHFHAIVQITYSYSRNRDTLFDDNYQRPEIMLDYRYIGSLLQQHFGNSLYVNFEPVKKLLDSQKDREDFERRFAWYVAKQRADAAAAAQRSPEEATEAMAREGLYTGVAQKSSKGVINKGSKRQRQRKSAGKNK